MAGQKKASWLDDGVAWVLVAFLVAKLQLGNEEERIVGEAGDLAKTRRRKEGGETVDGNVFAGGKAPSWADESFLLSPFILRVLASWREPFRLRFFLVSALPTT